MDYFEPRDNTCDWTEEEDFDLCCEMSELKSFYHNANILISGGSGFMGKVLIEKLLRCCDVGTIYLILREKKGKTPEERLKEQFKDELFNPLKFAKPDFIKHVKLIPGDMDKENIGLSQEDEQFVIENTNIVVHAAGALSMDEHMKRAYNVNVRATKIMLEMFQKMPQRKSFVYISTAYAHSHRTNIDEMFYPTSYTEEEVRDVVDALDDHSLGSLSPQLIDMYTNSYSFSKALAEEVCREYLNKGLPVCVVRPSIVISVSQEPVKAWINNIYGATGVLFGACIGLLHVFFADPEAKADIIPVDLAINTILAAIWSVAQQSTPAPVQHYEVTDKVFNIVSSPQNPITWDDFKVMNEQASTVFDLCSRKTLYHYSFGLTKNPSVFFWRVLLTHVVPAIIVDTFLRLKNKPPMLLKAHRKISNFLKHFHMYAEKDWLYTNDNVQNLWRLLSPNDRKTFYFNVAELDWTNFYFTYMRGLKWYIMNESSTFEDLEEARKKTERQKILHFFVKYGTRSALLCLMGYPILTSILSIYT